MRVRSFSRMRRFSMLAAILAAGLAVLFGTLAAPAFAAEETAASRVIPEYHLGANDKIRVITFGEESLTGEFFIGGSGKVSLPLIGEVQAAGLSVSAFQKEV